MQDGLERNRRPSLVAISKYGRPELPSIMPGLAEVSIQRASGYTVRLLPSSLIGEGCRQLCTWSDTCGWKC